MIYHIKQGRQHSSTLTSIRFFHIVKVMGYFGACPAEDPDIFVKQIFIFYCNSSSSPDLIISLSQLEKKYNYHSIRTISLLDYTMPV